MQQSEKFVAEFDVHYISMIVSCDTYIEKYILYNQIIIATTQYFWYWIQYITFYSNEENRCTMFDSIVNALANIKSRKLTNILYIIKD